MPLSSFGAAQRGATRPAGVKTYAASVAVGGLAVACLLIGARLSAASADRTSGGAGLSPAPEVREVRCRSNMHGPCTTVHSVQRGGTVDVSGRHLRHAKKVVFFGKRGAGDNVGSVARERRSASVLAKVPGEARSGPVAVVSQAGIRSRKWTGLRVEEPAETPPPAGEQEPTAIDGHVFPIRGRHQYSMSAGRFGASRGRRSHQGQDVFAACGTTLVAAFAGKVSYNRYHALAGYYLVVHGDGSGLDYVYMHLLGPAIPRTGDRVETGQPIGQVGQSGNARGCHLHFELWSAPGWYKGGRPFDPLPSLKRWDRQG